MEQYFLGDRVLLDDDYLGPATLHVSGDGTIISVTRGRHLQPPQGVQVRFIEYLLFLLSLATRVHPSCHQCMRCRRMYIQVACYNREAAGVTRAVITNCAGILVCAR